MNPIQPADEIVVKRLDAKKIWLKFNIVGTVEFEGQEYCFEEPVEIDAYRSLLE